jgi:hypothetical protein
MNQLFKKAAVFTDIHFGAKSNSTYHNEDCLAFVKWAVTKAREEGCETALFLGDWHNNRQAPRAQQAQERALRFNRLREGDARQGARQPAGNR